jgi:peptidoglycan/LPS O-acetylase OafA/YrhL
MPSSVSNPLTPPIDLNIGVADVRLLATAATRAISDKQLRLPFLDFMRALASQCIVLHHLVFYGPLPERAQVALPALFDWFYHNARMAVQVFFVLGGYFTSRGLAKYKSMSAKLVAKTIWARYRRIGIPYLAALAVAIMANELARTWMDHEAISARPTLLQLLAHAAFLHDVLGYPALTAGIWYLAIDFQLFLLTLGLFWIAQVWICRPSEAGRSEAHSVLLFLMSPLAVASLFWFNRDPNYDIWAIYFFGSYFLGIVLHSLLERSLHTGWAVAYWLLVVSAGIVDPRPRLLVAAGTALVVYMAKRTGLLNTWPNNRLVNYFGRTSYSVFLIHFPVLLLVNAWSAEHMGVSTSSALYGLCAAYILSLIAGIGLYHSVESRVR